MQVDRNLVVQPGPLPSLAAQAQELFDDPEFAELCDKGMNTQLQRTKDGATDKSRITELAGIFVSPRFRGNGPDIQHKEVDEKGFEKIDYPSFYHSIRHCRGQASLCPCQYS